MANGGFEVIIRQATADGATTLSVVQIAEDSTATMWLTKNPILDRQKLIQTLIRDC
jgi:hypothetical protein